LVPVTARVPRKNSFFGDETKYHPLFVYWSLLPSGFHQKIIKSPDPIKNWLTYFCIVIFKLTTKEQNRQIKNNR